MSRWRAGVLVGRAGAQAVGGLGLWALLWAGSSGRKPQRLPGGGAWWPSEGRATSQLRGGQVRSDLPREPGEGTSWGTVTLRCEHLLPQIAKDVKQFYDQALQQAIVDSSANNAKAVVKTFHEALNCCGSNTLMTLTTSVLKNSLCPSSGSVITNLFKEDCHGKIDELFSGKLYLIGIAAIVVAVIMVSGAHWLCLGTPPQHRVSELADLPLTPGSPPSHNLRELTTRPPPPADLEMILSMVLCCGIEQLGVLRLQPLRPQGGPQGPGSARSDPDTSRRGRHLCI
uniref:Uncharacterized protein n=1 Tax=Bos mutus grunniens TaxID=30521 RepID=A0A8B9XCC1_BOSMU